MNATRHISCLLTFLCVHVTGSLGVSPASATPLPDAKRVEARERFDRGLTLFNQGDNEGALAEFQRAYQLTSNATVLYNIARVYAAANEPVAALDALDQLLGQASDLSGPRRAAADTLRTEQRLRVGALTLTSPAPLAAARVEIDGADAGAFESGKERRLAAGRHVVGVLAPGHLPLRKALLLAGQEEKTLEFAPEPLQAALGKVHFMIEPIGVAVLLDGQELGRSPGLVESAIAPGVHHLQLARPGYRSIRRDVLVPEGGTFDVSETLTFDSASRANHDGQLLLNASEDDVVVFVDGKPVSDAATGTRLPEGDHQLRVERSGFLAMDRRFNLRRGGVTRVLATLEPTASYRAEYTSSAKSRRTWALGLGIGGAVLAGAGTAYLIWDQAQINDAQRAFDAALGEANGACRPATTAQCDERTSVAAIRANDLDSKQNKRLIGWIGVGAGAAALGTGIVLWVTGKDPQRYDPKPESDVFGSLHLKPWIGPGLAGGTLTGTL